MRKLHCGFTIPVMLITILVIGCGKDSSSASSTVGNDCTVNSDCSATEYCNKVDGDCDGAGVCAAMPEVCTMIYDPVCGCDGVTYASDCTAAGAGVNVLFTAMCIAAE